MTGPANSLALVSHIALLSIVSFGGIPSVLPDLHNYVVVTQGWVTDREFANFFAVAQALPGPNMILMLSFIGWRAGGVPVAAASALATFGPPCVLYFLGWRLWDRFRAAPWQRTVRAGLAPVTVGLVLGSGFVMARTAAAGWGDVAVTIAAAAVMLRSRLNPLWTLTAAGALGGLGLI